MNTNLIINILRELEGLTKITASSHSRKRYIELQKIILSNSDFLKKQERLLSLEKNPFDEDYLRLKEELLLIPEVIEYKELEANLFNLELKVNGLLKELLPEGKGCK